MSLKTLSSRDNPTFRGLLALSQQRKERARLGQTLLDGEHLLESALAVDCVPVLLVFSESAPDNLVKTWLQRLPNSPVLQLSNPLFKALSPVEHPSGIIAVVPLPAPKHFPSNHGERESNRCILLLDSIQDPGNLGALMRVAAAANCAHVFQSVGCTEAWSPKALRGGQGAQFVLSVHEGSDLVAIAQNYVGPVYAGLLGADKSLFDLNLGGPMGFAFGNEGAGLSDELQAVCQPFVIPMSGGVESLNVATAAAVCLFERVRQNQHQQG